MSKEGRNNKQQAQKNTYITQHANEPFGGAAPRKSEGTNFSALMIGFHETPAFFVPGSTHFYVKWEMDKSHWRAEKKQ